jgi:hypothetical protein
MEGDLLNLYIFIFCSEVHPYRIVHIPIGSHIPYSSVRGGDWSLRYGMFSWIAGSLRQSPTPRTLRFVWSSRGLSLAHPKVTATKQTQSHRRKLISRASKLCYGHTFSISFSDYHTPKYLIKYLINIVTSHDDVRGNEGVGPHIANLWRKIKFCP